ncbi:DUF4855 domain-containing protein [Pyrococcus horikoshii]|uniref:GH26 domain-containing protein n=2 Tax=Pyrococcus horikoshii TaxID=53953 RepID=O58692_PYRHO|nr:DUF4855 domain-containing protein [Pyrococcus horikoshii]BAA30070.1 358aa long hypothetical protein [Pyrococcus horikoshii OT3]
MILVLGIGLWWIRWNDTLGGYESRMTLGGRSPGTYYDEVQLFKERGFDRVVFLGEEGRGINYTGNGFADARYLALWIRTHITSIDYYITIPFSYGSGELRDNPANGFENSYWRSWIDGVLGVDDDNRLGFYWSYESCLQGTINDPAIEKLKINDKEQYKEDYIQFIQEMSDYIHSHGLELIWIPATGNRGISFLNDYNFDGIPSIGGYFDYVFVQPNYYQNSILTEKSGRTDYTYEKLVEKVRWVYTTLRDHIKKQNLNTIVSIEMEVYRSILYDYISQTHIEENFRESLIERCGSGFTRECLIQYTYDAKEIAFHYLKSQKDVLGEKYKDLAYYFSVDFKVIDEMEGFSRRLGEEYV